jgi:hypothetical protein
MSNNTAKHAAFETIVSRFGPDTAKKFAYSFNLEKLRAEYESKNADAFDVMTVVEGAAVLGVVKEVIQKGYTGYADLMAYAYYLDLNLRHRISDSRPGTIVHFLVESHRIHSLRPSAE